MYLILWPLEQFSLNDRFKTFFYGMKTASNNQKYTQLRNC